MLTHDNSFVTSVFCNATIETSYDPTDGFKDSKRIDR